MEKSNIKNNFIWNIIGSTFNAFSSLLFLIMITRINGVEEAGLFTFGFSTACLFYVIGIYFGRVYQVTDDNPDISDSDYLFSKFITCGIMILASFIFCLLRGYHIYKFAVIMGLVIFKSCEAFSEGLYAIIQEHNDLYKVGKSLFFKAFFGILFFVLVDYIYKNILVSICFLILINILFILFYDLKNTFKVGFIFERFSNKKVLLILKQGFFAFVFAFLTQYVINAPRYAIDSILSDDIQAIFGILIMPATVLILLGQFIIHPFLVKLKDTLNSNKRVFLTMTFKMVIALVGLGVFIIFCAFFLGIPSLELLYHIPLNGYLNELLLVLLGAIFYGISVIISTSLTTMRYTFSQMIIFIVVSIFSYFLSNYMVLHYGLTGAIYTYVSSMLILLFLYLIVFLILFKKYKVSKVICSNEKK